jgi:hypothetical protein
MGSRGCTAVREDGSPCGATRRRDVPFCFWHDAASVPEADEARRVGGLRRRREGAVAIAYDISGVVTIEEQQRILEIATLETLALPNSIARSRTLIDIVRVGLKVREAGQLEARVAALEAALAARSPATQPPGGAFGDALTFEKATTLDEEKP